MVYINCGKSHHFSYTQSKFMGGAPLPPEMICPKKPGWNPEQRKIMKSGIVELFTTIFNSNFQYGIIIIYKNLTKTCGVPSTNSF